MEVKSRLLAKGSGSTGCLLQATLDDQKEFVPLELGFRVKELQLSGSFVMATDDQESLYVWGTVGKDLLEKPCLMKTKVRRLSCGWQHGMFQSIQGLWGIGANGNYELGIETPSKFVNAPTIVWEGKVEHFICGFRQSYVVAQNSLFGCGQSRKYELGISEKKPVKWRQIYANITVRLQKQIVQMSCGKRFLLLRTAEGSIWALGCNDQNCFNKAEVTHLIVPTMIFQSILDVSCGWAHLILLDKEREIHTFGRKNLGQLGKEEDKPLFLPLKEAEHVQSVNSGTEFGFALTSFGRVFAWGWNQHSNLSNCGSWSLQQPKNISVPGKCIRLWTHPAITIIQYVQQ